MRLVKQVTVHYCTCTTDNKNKHSTVEATLNVWEQDGKTYYSNGGKE